MTDTKKKKSKAAPTGRIWDAYMIVNACGQHKGRIFTSEDECRRSGALMGFEDIVRVEIIERK